MVERPSLKVVRALAAVLELEADEMFKAESDPDEDRRRERGGLAAKRVRPRPVASARARKDTQDKLFRK